MSNGIKNFFSFIFSKEKKPDGVIDYFEIKQYHSIRYSLIYAKESLVFEDDKIEIYSRIYKDITLVNILINDETNFNKNNYTYDKIVALLDKASLEHTDSSIVLFIFQNKNEFTTNICKELIGCTKNYFIQGLVYDESRVTLDYYRSVPDFYVKMHEAYCEDIYFDLAAIDKTRE